MIIKLYIWKILGVDFNWFYINYINMHLKYKEESSINLIFQIEEDQSDGVKIWLTGLITFLESDAFSNTTSYLRIWVVQRSCSMPVSWYIKLCCKFEIAGLPASHFRMDGKPQSLFLFLFAMNGYWIFRIEISRDWHFNEI